MKIRASILLFLISMTIACVSSAVPKDQRTSARVDTSVVPKMEELRGKAGDTFDPHAYFTVLTHIGMKGGYVLDYVYWKDGLGSYPCLYARRSSEPRKKVELPEPRSAEEMKKLRDSLGGICDGKNIVNLLPLMTADDSADSFFQLSVFLKMARQFRLGWHAHYNDIRVLTSAADIDEIVQEVNSFGSRNKESDPNKALWLRAKKWLTEPEVVLTPDTAEVTYSTFTKWGGFARVKDTFTRTSPPALLPSEVLDTIDYNCGIRF